MAIYHLTAKTVSRGESASAAVRSDYIERSGGYAGDHAELLHKGHGNMPVWAEHCPRNYWEAADTFERANGRLFKQLEFALPKELSPEGQTELAASFCRELAMTKDGPLPYSFAVHKGHDKENPHCHLLISERVNDGHNSEPCLWFKRAAADPAKGGARKTNELRPREWLFQCRALWAKRANLALEHAGHEARIDHRTLEAQGIDRAPTTHLGPSVAAMESQGIRTQRGNRSRRREDEALEAVKAKWGAKIDSIRAEKLPRQKLYSLVKLARAHEAEELAQTRRDLALKRSGGKENSYTVLQDIRAEYAAKARAIQENTKLAHSGKTGLLAILKMQQLAAEETALGKENPFAGARGDIDANGHVLFTLAGGGLIRDAGMQVSFSAGDQAAQAAALRYAGAKWGPQARMNGNTFHRAPIIAKAQMPVLEPTPAEKQNAPTPAPVPTTEECRAALLAVAKQEPYKVESYYQAQIKPYMEYIADAEDKAAAFAFCHERMKEDATTGSARLKEMGQELSERLRGFGGTWAKQDALRQEALDHIKIAPDREEAFTEVTKGIDMALERSRGLER
jgi:hypothetical protein